MLKMRLGCICSGAGCTVADGVGGGGVLFGVGVQWVLGGGTGTVMEGVGAGVAITEGTCFFN